MLLLDGLGRIADSHEFHIHRQRHKNRSGRILLLNLFEDLPLRSELSCFDQPLTRVPV